MNVSAIVLAAGQSSRMGSPKMILPWGSSTVIGRVVDVLQQAGIEDIIVVTGGARQLVEQALAGKPVRAVFNPRYQQDHMTYSLQTGLLELGEQVSAALVALGDQPQIEAPVVLAVLQAYLEKGSPLVIPSYQMRRGHPWLVDRALWGGLLGLLPPATLRDFLNRHQEQIEYLPVAADSVLRDLDTPLDYQREHPAL
ncbi:MAG: nucleotidyltransferase family protein [Anaerolineales bacterium]|nr:nucleotidyltransferase family protein [Anaerolineales bacterium]